MSGVKLHNKRTIFVCNLLAANSYKNVPFKLKGDCADDDFINYDILYTPILVSNDYETLINQFIKKLIAKQSEITSICVSLLIVGYLYRNNLGDACKFLVDQLPPSLKGNTTIYNFDSSNRVDLPFEMDNIKYKRVINKAIQKSSVTTYIENNKVMYSRVEDGGFLDCEAWFNRYLATVFDCAKARLKQRSGTCYINVVINGFLLDKTFRNMFMFFLITDTDTEDVKKPIIPAIKNVLSSRDEEYFKKHFNLSKYVFQILYTCICKKQTFFTVDNFEADFLIDYEKAVSKDVDRQAKKMFNLLISSFPVEIKNKIILDRYHNLFIGETFLKVIKIKNIFYSLTFALIHIRFFESENHFVTGYICNGIPKVYDPNGLFYNFDWITGKNFHLFAKELAYNYKTRVLKMIIAPIYVENELKTSFDNFDMTDDQFCSLIR